MITLALQDHANDVHDEGSKSGNSIEDSFNDTLGQGLKLSVAVSDELLSWITQLIKLWRNQVLQDIHGGETRDAVALMHSNSTLNRHI